MKKILFLLMSIAVISSTASNSVACKRQHNITAKEAEQNFKYYAKKNKIPAPQSYLWSKFLNIKTLSSVKRDLCDQPFEFIAIYTEPNNYNILVFFIDFNSTIYILSEKLIKITI